MTCAADESGAQLDRVAGGGDRLVELAAHGRQPRRAPCSCRAIRRRRQRRRAPLRGRPGGTASAPSLIASSGLAACTPREGLVRDGGLRIPRDRVTRGGARLLGSIELEAAAIARRKRRRGSASSVAMARPRTSSASWGRCSSISCTGANRLRWCSTRVSSRDPIRDDRRRLLETRRRCRRRGRGSGLRPRRHPRRPLPRSSRAPRRGAERAAGAPSGTR